MKQFPSEHETTALLKYHHFLFSNIPHDVLRVTKLDHGLFTCTIKGVIYFFFVREKKIKK